MLKLLEVEVAYSNDLETLFFDTFRSSRNYDYSVLVSHDSYIPGYLLLSLCMIREVFSMSALMKKKAAPLELCRVRSSEASLEF